MAATCPTKALDTPAAQTNDTPSQDIPSSIQTHQSSHPGGDQEIDPIDSINPDLVGPTPRRASDPLPQCGEDSCDDPALLGAMAELKQIRERLLTAIRNHVRTLTFSPTLTHIPSPTSPLQPIASQPLPGFAVQVPVHVLATYKKVVLSQRHAHYSCSPRLSCSHPLSPSPLTTCI